MVQIYIIFNPIYKFEGICAEISTQLRSGKLSDNSNNVITRLPCKINIPKIHPKGYKINLAAFVKERQRPTPILKPGSDGNAN